MKQGIKSAFYDNNFTVMKISVSVITDAAFCLAAGFVLSFIFVNYFVPRPASFVLAATFAVIFTLFGVKLSLDKKRKTFSSKEKEKIFGSVMTRLNLMDEKSVVDLFAKAFAKEGFCPEKKNGGIFIREKNTTAFFKFRFDGVSKTDVVKCFNKIIKNQKAEIFSETFTDEVKAFAARFGGKIILTDGKTAFGLLEKHSLLPKEKISLDDENGKKPNFARLLDKKRAKSYLAFGLLFTVLSYFAPIKVYYLVFGAAFLVLALILRLFGKTAA